MGYYDGPGGGMGLLARTLAYNYDLYVDNYVAVNMVVFEEIIDAMGGIDIYLTEPVDGRPVGMDDVDPYKQGQGYFKAGWNHLTGFDALSFCAHSISLWGGRTYRFIRRLFFVQFKKN